MYIVSEANADNERVFNADIRISIHVPLYSLYRLVYVESTRKVIFLYFDDDFH